LRLSGPLCCSRRLFNQFPAQPLTLRFIGGRIL
jgi:hypothetical protein